jgi:hypothetical protein
MQGSHAIASAGCADYLSGDDSQAGGLKGLEASTTEIFPVASVVKPSSKETQPMIDLAARPTRSWLFKPAQFTPDFTNQYPRQIPARITVRLMDGEVIENQVQDYPGLASRPLHLGGLRRKVRPAGGRPGRRRTLARDQGRRAFARNHSGQGPDRAARPCRGLASGLTDDSRNIDGHHSRPCS